MICWKCKHEMPDGLKYCGHCGVRLNRVLHFLEWLFSRKGLPVLLVILALLLGGLALWLIPKLTLPAINIDFDLNMGLYQPSDDDIVFTDDSKSHGYVSNMILIFFNRDATPERIGQIVAELDGEVVGIMPGVNQYQVKVTGRTEEELEELRQQLMSYDEVKHAVIDYVSTVEGETVPNDPWTDPSGQNSEAVWNEDAPSGANWWPEATRVLSAWGYRDYFSNIKVGISDNGFDTAHEDLSITVINEALNNAEGHGTHVAGIIGATHDNGVGISGVLADVSLYGVDCFATELQDAQHITISSLLGGIDLCLSQGCRVVNMSAGLSYDYVAGNPQAVRDNARSTVEYLIMMLDYTQEDFLIVKSAGNAGVDAHDYNGYFCSIDEELVREVLGQMKADGVKLEKDITVEDVMNSFLVVGAVDYPDQGYQLASFSNFGDSVTICAPGVHILSTVPGDYDFKNGTSMAAPVVTGITAMVWSVDPTMSAAQVREILLSTATEQVAPVNAGDNGSYYMINAQAAVEKAIGILGSQDPTDPSTDPTQGTDAPTDPTQGTGTTYSLEDCYQFWDYEGLTFVQSKVATCQAVTGAPCEFSDFNFDFLNEDYDDLVQGYDPYRGVFIYRYDEDAMNDYIAYLESVGFVRYHVEEYTNGTSYFYENSTYGYYMDIFVVDDESLFAIEPYMNAEEDSSDPTEPYDGLPIIPKLAFYMGDLLRETIPSRKLTDGVNPNAYGYLYTYEANVDALPVLQEYLDLLVQEYHFTLNTKVQDGTTLYYLRFNGVDQPELFSNNHHYLISVTQLSDTLVQLDVCAEHSIGTINLSRNP